VFNESIHTNVGSPVRFNNSIKAQFNIVGETKVVSDGRSQMQRVSLFSYSTYIISKKFRFGLWWYLTMEIADVFY